MGELMMSVEEKNEEHWEVRINFERKGKECSEDDNE
jgi:hypothetical protein